MEVLRKEAASSREQLMLAEGRIQSKDLLLKQSSSRVDTLRQTVSSLQEEILGKLHYCIIFA